MDPHHHLPGSPSSRNPRSFATFPFHQPMLAAHHQESSLQPGSEDDEHSPNSRSSDPQQKQQVQVQGTVQLSTQSQRPQKSPKLEPGASASGSGEVVARKPRGRPPGSKNKPKPPIVIHRETMRPHVLEVAPGTDVVEAIAGYARRIKRGVCVLSGKGALTTLTLLRHPSQQQNSTNHPSSSNTSSQNPQAQHNQQRTASSPPSSPSADAASAAAAASSVTYNGRFELLSMSGAFLQQIPGSGIFSGLAVSVAGGPQGQVFGGSVAGPLISAGHVVIIATSFDGSCYERLPIDEHEEHEQGGIQVNQAALQGNSPTATIHQLMNDPFGLVHHHSHLGPASAPSAEALATWAATGAVGRPPGA